MKNCSVMTSAFSGGNAGIIKSPGGWLTALIPSATANKPAEVVAMLQLGFGYSVAGLVLFIYSMVFVDINSISLHTFYRDRLSKA